MPTIIYRGEPLEALTEETVLACLERHGRAVISSCRSGVCQSCVLRAEDGTAQSLPSVAQAGLKSSHKRQGDFLACQCPAIDGLRIGSGVRKVSARVVRTQALASGVTGVHLQLEELFPFEAGQFLQVRRADGIARPYSIASLPGGAELELHVAVLPGGRLSPWLSEALGEQVELVGPQGDCIYLDLLDEPLVLAGTGTGLAPLLGVLRQALASGHRGPIQLFHGAKTTDDLYYMTHLQELAAAHPQLEVWGSTLQQCRVVRPGVKNQPLDQMVAEHARQPGASRAYLCGHPDFVRKLKKQLFLAGTSLDKIHSDPFSPAA